VIVEVELKRGVIVATSASLCLGPLVGRRILDARRGLPWSSAGSSRTCSGEEADRAKASASASIAAMSARTWRPWSCSVGSGAWPRSVPMILRIPGQGCG
jgi:hypothetical protein